VVLVCAGGDERGLVGGGGYESDIHLKPSISLICISQTALAIFINHVSIITYLTDRHGPNGVSRLFGHGMCDRLGAIAANHFNNAQRLCVSQKECAILVGHKPKRTCSRPSFLDNA